MADREKDPFTLFAEALTRTTVAKARRIEVLAGKDHLADRRAPSLSEPAPIVLYPTTGKIEAPHNVEDSLRDDEQIVAFRIWGYDLTQAWLLLRVLTHALDEHKDQAVSFYWKGAAVGFDPKADTAQSGQELELILTLRLALDRVPLAEGQVDEVDLNRT